MRLNFLLGLVHAIRLMPAPPFVICAARACVCVCVRNASVGTHTHTYKRCITIWIGASVDKINDNDQYMCSYSFYALFLFLAPLRSFAPQKKKECAITGTLAAQFQHRLDILRLTTKPLHVICNVKQKSRLRSTYLSCTGRADTPRIVNDSCQRK